MSLFMLFADQLTPLLGEMSSHHPYFLLAVYAPGISGIFLFLVWRHYGLTGLGGFFRRLTLWRAPIQWWLLLLLGIPVIVYAAAAITGTIQHHPQEQAREERLLARHGRNLHIPSLIFVINSGLVDNAAPLTIPTFVNRSGMA